MLNIEEIKAQYAVALKSIEDSVDDDVADFGIYPALHTIPALIAEVEQDEKLIESYKESGLEQATEEYELEQENATLKKELEAYKATGFTPEQISAGTTVTFDIGNDGFLTAINSAFKEQFGIIANDVPKIIAERDTLKKALEIASSEANTAFETLASHHVIAWEQKANNVQDNVDTWIKRAEQAQQLTHETHGECEAGHAK